MFFSIYISLIKLGLRFDLVLYTTVISKCSFFVWRDRVLPLCCKVSNWDVVSYHIVNGCRKERTGGDYVKEHEIENLHDQDEVWLTVNRKGIL